MKTEMIELLPGRSDVSLTSYLWSDTPALLGEKKRPAVLICPGGAYLFCSDREAEPVALRFTAMGYHAFVLRYSVFSAGDPSSVRWPLDARHMRVNPNSLFPAPMRDIGTAMLAIRAHAEEWRVDVDRIALCGFSAGAHNCAMYSVYWQDPLIHAYLGSEPASLRPAAAILAYGIYDYHLLFGEHRDPTTKALAEAASIALLGTPSPSEELLDAASPVSRVTEHMPPAFLWATATDELVPVENTTRMAQALARANRPFEVHIFEDGQHGLGLADQASSGSENEINPEAARWVTLAETWLRKRLALPLPPKPAFMTEQGDATHEPR